jgi:hypothetical protein
MIIFNQSSSSDKLVKYHMMSFLAFLQIQLNLANTNTICTAINSYSSVTDMYWVKKPRIGRIIFHVFPRPMIPTVGNDVLNDLKRL